MTIDALQALAERYADSADHAILNDDFRTICGAVRQAWEAMFAPNLEWMSTTQIRVPAAAGAPARVMMAGIPNAKNFGDLVTGGLTDGWYRENVADWELAITTAGHRWGTEKSSQWYIVYAVAGDADADFDVKLMPLTRFSSQASQVITLRNNLNAANIGYGFTTDELIDSVIYVLSGASIGLLRTIIANNNNDATGGTIEYSGAALTMSQGDWFAILPATNFRFLGTIFNNSSGDIQRFEKTGRFVSWVSTAVEPTTYALTTAAQAVAGYCPLAGKAVVTITSGPTFYLARVTCCNYYAADAICQGYEYPAGAGLG